MTEPVIVIGAPRSGTTLTTRLLGEMGVFMGARRDVNDEATLFLHADALIMRAAGARWDDPGPTASMLAGPAGMARATKIARRRLRDPWAAGYLGRRRLSTRTPGRLDEPWGWKDPRSTFTLPAWLELFPDARVIHVIRHGVDVAASLWDGRWTGVAGIERPRWTIWAIRSRWRRQREIGAGLRLWDAYVTEARRHGPGLGERFCEIRFEDLCFEPEQALARLARFAVAEAPAAELDRLRGQIDASRALAHTSDPRLSAAAREHAGLLSRHGYEPRVAA